MQVGLQGVNSNILTLCNHNFLIFRQIIVLGLQMILRDNQKAVFFLIEKKTEAQENVLSRRNLIK